MTVQQALVLGFGIGISTACALFYGWLRDVRQVLATERRRRDASDVQVNACLERIAKDRQLRDLLSDRSALINIRMDIQDAAEHYSEGVHPRMMRIVDGLLDEAALQEDAP